MTTRQADLQHLGRVYWYDRGYKLDRYGGAPICIYSYCRHGGNGSGYGHEAAVAHASSRYRCDFVTEARYSLVGAE